MWCIDNIYKFIGVGFLLLLVQLGRAMREASGRGTSNVVGFSRFFVDRGIIIFTLNRQRLRINRHLIFYIMSIRLLFILSICIGMLTSCGSSKKMTTGTVNSEKKIEQDECIIMADGNPNRAWGEATNGRLAYAKQYAEGQARAALARKISSAITTATNENDLQYDKASYNGTEGAIVSDQGSKAEGKTMQIAKLVLNNVVVMKTSVYQRPNGLFHVYVCVEQQDSPHELASKINGKVKQQVSDEDRLKMDYQFKKFEETVEKELQKMNDEKYKQ